MRSTSTAALAAVWAVACSFSTDVEFGHVQDAPTSDNLTTGQARAAPPRSTEGALVVDCDAPGPEVGAQLYGIAFADAPLDLGATAHRWGGNSTTRYNFELGNTWNLAQDWYWQNQVIDPWQTFVDKAATKGGFAAITVPIMGWVAKDTDSYSFSIARLGSQWSHDPQADKTDRGNGIDASGRPIPPPPPDTTSVPITPDQVGAWVTAIKAHGGPVRTYILDNEPGLWNTTHRDVHPDPMTYDELMDKTVAYATAIRAADPDALIAGPASHGWWEYFYSAKDHEAGFDAKPDRLAHGDVPFLAWYLDRLAEYEERTGVRLLDVLDVHFYPQSTGVQGNQGDGERTDAETNARRVRGVRSLWDPTYVDESVDRRLGAAVAAHAGPDRRALPWFAAGHRRVQLRRRAGSLGGRCPRRGSGAHGAGWRRVRLLLDGPARGLCRSRRVPGVRQL